MAQAGFTFRCGDPAEVRDMLGWLRAHNTGGGRVRFAGLDVPGSGGSPLPALHRVRDYLGTNAAAQAGLADAAIEAATPYSAANNSAALARYTTLSTAQRDAATAALSRLLLRLDGLPPGDTPRERLIARHHALGALRLDEQLRELVDLGEPERPGMAVSSRDVYQAETVRLLRELSSPDERIVLMMHNAHVQRVPMSLLPGRLAHSTGSHLAAERPGLPGHRGHRTPVAPPTGGWTSRRGKDSRW